MTLSSTLGNASFSVTLFCCIGLNGRGGFGGAAGGAVVVGVGSRLLSSGALSSDLSAILPSCYSLTDGAAQLTRASP